MAGLLEHVDGQQRSSDRRPEQSAGEAENLTFGDGNPNSTSGFLVPGYYILPKTISPPATLSAPSTPGMNQRAGRRQQAGGCCHQRRENLDKLKTSAPEKLKELKVIWKSPLNPRQSNRLARESLRNHERQDLRLLVRKLPAETRKKEPVLERLGWAPLHASSDLQLVPIRQLALFA
ncbi:PhnD/SsuA/transferrin family substrate-binding protein [Shigella flexneri]